ncbi:MAG: rane protein FdrA, partial [Burkholderiales bacterium]|nr:rane protein FdrA [Burkholderiales bacterium]
MIDALLAGPVRVVNLGLAGFARELASQGTAVAQVEWKPPARGDPELISALGSLSSGAIDKANEAVLERILAADPVLADVRRAGELIPELDAGRLMLHAGPPIEWQRMCGPLKGAVCGAIVFEGWASDLAAAEKLVLQGGVQFAPNHHFGAVGPMTGITTGSMPLLVVENRTFGNRAVCAINEGVGKV